MDSRTETLTEESLRRSLHSYLIVQQQVEPDTTVIYELGLCQGSARVDLAVIDGQLHGYEIKSERDSLRRLRAQADLYNKVFDRVTLVCTEKAHMRGALNHSHLVGSIAGRSHSTDPTVRVCQDRP